MIGTEEKDAIHIAIAPVVASEKLAPGQNIGIIKKNIVGVTENNIDPFLKNLVYPDQQFWMFLYPNTITSLKHTWSHPAFDSEAWLTNYANAKKYQDTGEQGFLSYDLPDICLGNMGTENSYLNIFRCSC